MKELELILAAISNLGAAGKEAFIWWLVFDKLIQPGMWVSAICVVAHFAWRVISIGSLACDLRDAMGVGSPGPLIKEEIRDMRAWISARRNAPPANN